MRIAVGTFTDGFMGGAPGGGVHLFELDPAEPLAREVQVVGGLISPSYLARHPHLPLLYAAERAWSGEDKAEGALSTLAIGQDGALSLLDRRRAGGAFSAHVAVSPDGGLCALANPLGPNLTVFPLSEEGIPGDAECFAFSGQGARPRQSAPWPHSCWFDAAGKRMFACDLGLDIVSIYDVAADGTSVAPAAFARAQVSSGAGARHMALRDDGRFAYVANELDGTISVFAIDDERGTLTILQTLPCAQQASQPCEIVCDAAGRHLYVTLRGPEAVAVFAIDAESGTLTPRQMASCLGDTPRHIALSPDGALALVSNQLSGQVMGFAIDAATGALAPTGLVIPVPSPACVVFL